MEHPDDSKRRSYCPAGLVPDEPENVVSFFVTDENDEPVGVLEKWSGGKWIYADVDDFIDTQ